MEPAGAQTFNAPFPEGNPVLAGNPELTLCPPLARVHNRDMDSMSAQQRSQLMSKIKGKNTKPELLVRKLLHAAGYRYRLQGNIPRSTFEKILKDHPDAHLPGGKLPGRPDLVFSARHKVVFVNGCFWHLHDCPAGQHAPQTNAEFWEAKRTATRDRDLRSIVVLEDLGWQSLVLWECELRDQEVVLDRLSRFLGASAGSTAAPSKSV
ncbi:very short patch repair endonuclease [Paeniglutamicibacter sp. NPDC012692]|uniref:very short patch repair endonuclease n=1 Tax=Paeniglutamicibacter sp. NPDC012692 TaxID=3364388 RepID=UPI0036CBB213